MSDPLVAAPPHYTQGRFGDVEQIHFTGLMMFNPGNAFKYVWRCEDKGDPVRDLEKARTYLGWARESGEALCPQRNWHILSALYFRHLHPKEGTDWMARVLGHILWENWDVANDGIDARHAFFVANGGKP